jgi:hypothetical protein
MYSQSQQLARHVPTGQRMQRFPTRREIRKRCILRFGPWQEQEMVDMGTSNFITNKPELSIVRQAASLSLFSLPLAYVWVDNDVELVRFKDSHRCTRF